MQTPCGHATQQRISTVCARSFASVRLAPESRAERASDNHGPLANSANASSRLTYPPRLTEYEDLALGKVNEGEDRYA